MAQSAALKAAHEQLAYWQRECEAARRSGDSQRIAQCERYITQCEVVIGALTSGNRARKTVSPRARRDRNGSRGQRF
jgi:hypothetical protein